MAEYTRIIENLVLTKTMVLSGPEWNNTLIRNVTIENVQGDGIMLRNVENVRIENVTIRNVTGDGIKLSMLGSTRNVVIADSLIQNTGEDGINAGQRASSGVDHPGLQILNNTIDTTGLASSNTGLVHGLYIQSTDPLIEGNQILNSTDGNGISIRSSGIVQGNLVDGSYKSGISYYADHDAGASNTLLIKDNVIISAGLGGSRSDIDVLGVPSGKAGAVVGTIVVIENFLTAPDQTYVDVSEGFSNTGGVVISDNSFGSEAIARLNNGTHSADTVAGGDEADRINGYRGNDILRGNAGSDVIFGGGGNDTLNGGLDDDILEGGEGNDTLLGGAGIDTVRYSGGQGISIDLSITVAQDTGVGMDSIRGVENVMSGAGNDSLTGHSGANILDSGDGDDSLSGLRGSDTLVGGRGDDRLSGGLGTDTLWGGAGFDQFVFDQALVLANADSIADFNSGIDQILLDRSIFKTLQAGALDEASFSVSSGGNAQDRTDRILYDSDTGTLWYDADGTGSLGRQKIGVLVLAPGIVADDFLIM